MMRLLHLALLSFLFALPVFQAPAAEHDTRDSPQFVNINEANAETLSRVLVGVGLVRARAIVEYRENHGRFYNAEELTAVRGVGAKTIERNLERIRLE